MNRNVVILLLLAAGVFAGVWYAAGKEQAKVVPEAAASPDTGTPAAKVPVAMPVANPAAEVTASAADVMRWTAEVNSNNAGTRAAAIRALADAPRADALPVLHHVLINGEPQVDRPLALQSLRELALGQGDKDGKVREAIREVLYHGDDQNPTLMADAQDALDVVEESELR